ncbi:putative homoserine kinase type II [Nostocoides japonicum T1-X7]|uniref:Hydroxylysine kinase n=1 Tax=Nostocoides japonicum T1-X7 TaxID=1194083 RepID=A0A077LU24_9MICO|nr:phosphotransferase [Tetrasphaera japonica]CCH76951.1 putative homoserine kinase type II [Tetrasphaera japonica T1-X7]
MSNAGPTASTRPTGAADVLDGGGLATAHVPMQASEAGDLLRRHFAIEGALTPLPTEKDDTFAVAADDGARYVLKVANPDEPPTEVDFQLSLIDHVAEADPSLPVPRVCRDVTGGRFAAITDSAGQGRCASVLTYLEGTPLDGTVSSAVERERIGEVLGRLRLAMAAFSHPADSRQLAWDVRHAPALRPLLEGVADRARRDRLTEGMERVVAIHDEVLTLRTQVLHNDFSRSNLIIDHDDPRFVTGIIDFGDSVRTAIAVDVSTALLNQLPRAVEDPSVDLFADARDVLRGYLSVTELTRQELRLVPHLVMSRVVCRALITLRRVQLMPGNTAYIMRNTEQGWGQLDWFLARSTGDVSDLLDPPA